MKIEKISLGLILLAIGSVLLLGNLGLVDFDWHAVFRLWPVLVIAIGLHFLVPKGAAGGIISVLIVLAAIAVLVYTGIVSTEEYVWH